MSDVNAEMKASADYAVKAARERFRQELDYSERSLAKLEHILEEIYWGFSHTTRDEGGHGLIFTTATIWGSYLGEYIRVKWGGTWIVKGSDTLVSINDNEFSPIGLVYQKITSHPEYSVENYIEKVKRELYPPVIIPQKSQSIPQKSQPIPQKSQPTVEKLIQPNVQKAIKESKNPIVINKRLLIALASVGGFLFLILVSIFGYKMIRAGNVPAFGLLASATRSNANIPIVISQVTATPSSTNTPYSTVTLLPTYTPKPTITPLLTHTPTPTYTQITTLTPTVTQTPTVTKTKLPSLSPTSRRRTPTSTQIPATELPPPTAPPPPTNTQPPPPTNTQPPPVGIQSCEINPSTVPAGINVTVTFIVHFSSPGYGFDALVNPDFPGQSGCSGADGDGDGIASCDGSSGLLPNSITINVTLRSSVGECNVSYSSQ